MGIGSVGFLSVDVIEDVGVSVSASPSFPPWTSRLALVLVGVLLWRFVLVMREELRILILMPFGVAVAERVCK